MPITENAHEAPFEAIGVPKRVSAQACASASATSQQASARLASSREVTSTS